MSSYAQILFALPVSFLTNVCRTDSESRINKIEISLFMKRIHKDKNAHYFLTVLYGCINLLVILR